LFGPILQAVFPHPKLVSFLTERRMLLVGTACLSSTAAILNVSLWNAQVLLAPFILVPRPTLDITSALVSINMLLISVTVVLNSSDSSAHIRYFRSLDDPQWSFSISTKCVCPLQFVDPGRRPPTPSARG
jgi:hypothetical protein